MDFLVCCIYVLQNKKQLECLKSREKRTTFVDVIYVFKIERTDQRTWKREYFLVWQRIRKGSPKRKMHLQQRIFPSVTGSVHLTLIYSILM